MSTCTSECLKIHEWCDCAHWYASVFCAYASVFKAIYSEFWRWSEGLCTCAQFQDDWDIWEKNTKYAPSFIMSSYSMHPYPLSWQCHLLIRFLSFLVNLSGHHSWGFTSRTSRTISGSIVKHPPCPPFCTHLYLSTIIIDSLLQYPFLLLTPSTCLLFTCSPLYTHKPHCQRQIDSPNLWITVQKSTISAFLTYTQAHLNYSPTIIHKENHSLAINSPNYLLLSLSNPSPNSSKTHKLVTRQPNLSRLFHTPNNVCFPHMCMRSNHQFTGIC